MPYKSQAQRKYMHVKHPEIAKRWDKKYKTPKNLPEKKGRNKSNKKKRYA
jgi:hypothetical protein